MTEQRDQTRETIIADLERIAREVPALPSTFSELRALLGLIEPIGGLNPYFYRGSDWNPQAAGQALNQQMLLGVPPQNQTQQTVVPGVANVVQTADTQLLRTGVKQMTYADLTYGPATLIVDGDLIEGLNANWSFTYNGDGTLASASRSGVAGSATVTISYSTPGVISTIVVVKGGKTVTVTPTYSGGRIASFARAVT